MNKFRIFTVTSLTLFLFSCNKATTEFDARKAADEYCSCLHEQQKKYDFFDSRIICDSKLTLKNRFFRLDQGSVMFGNRLSKLPKATADSVIEFSNQFFHYIFEICDHAVTEDVNYDLKFPETSVSP